jgi:DNA-binding NarL/FixJ family response regulator
MQEGAYLTPTEIELVRLYVGGKVSKEIAVLRSRSVKTIETHRANIMRKLECHCTADLVLCAIRKGLIDGYYYSHEGLGFS